MPDNVRQLFPPAEVKIDPARYNEVKSYNNRFFDITSDDTHSYSSVVGAILEIVGSLEVGGTVIHHLSFSSNCLDAMNGGVLMVSTLGEIEKPG